MNRVFYASCAAPILSQGVDCRPIGRDKQYCRALRVFVALSMVVGVLLSGGSLRAQTFYGSISGVVKDSSGAVVPKVAVTVHENSTTTDYKTVTDKGGSYRVSFLKPGSYTVRFETAGFGQYVTDQLNLVLNQELVVDGVLRVGTTSEVVTVTGAGTSLNYTNPQVGGELSTQELIDLPEATGTKARMSSLLRRHSLALRARARTTPMLITSRWAAGDRFRTLSSSMVSPSNMGVDGTYGLIPTPRLYRRASGFDGAILGPVRTERRRRNPNHYQVRYEQISRAPPLSPTAPRISPR